MKKCDAVETSGEDPTNCALKAGHRGLHMSKKCRRYDASGTPMKRGRMWLVWNGRTIKENEF